MVEEADGGYVITQYATDDEGWNRRMHGCID